MNISLALGVDTHCSLVAAFRRVDEPELAKSKCRLNSRTAAMKRNDP
jgi:hypothetical protein